MTYTVVDRQKESIGSMHYETVTVDITSTDALGVENLGATDETQLVGEVVEARVSSQSDAGYVVEYDHVNDQLQVKYADYDAAADGALIDVPSATAVGQVQLTVVGK